MAHFLSGLVISTLIFWPQNWPANSGQHFC